MSRRFGRLILNCQLLHDAIEELDPSNHQYTSDQYELKQQNKKIIAKLLTLVIPIRSQDNWYQYVTIWTCYSQNFRLIKEGDIIPIYHLDIQEKEGKIVIDFIEISGHPDPLTIA